MGITYGMDSSLENEKRCKTQAGEMRVSCKLTSLYIDIPVWNQQYDTKSNKNIKKVKKMKEQKYTVRMRKRKGQKISTSTAWESNSDRKREKGKARKSVSSFETTSKGVKNAQRSSRLRRRNSHSLQLQDLILGKVLCHTKKWLK